MQAHIASVWACGRRANLCSGYSLEIDGIAALELQWTRWYMSPSYGMTFGDGFGCYSNLQSGYDVGYSCEVFLRDNLDQMLHYSCEMTLSVDSGVRRLMKFLSRYPRLTGRAFEIDAWKPCLWEKRRYVSVEKTYQACEKKSNPGGILAFARLHEMRLRDVIEARMYMHRIGAFYRNGDE